MERPGGTDGTNGQGKGAEQHKEGLRQTEGSIHTEEQPPNKQERQSTNISSRQFTPTDYS